MSSKEVENIIHQYKSASHKGKEMLRLKYGKKQIEIIVERYLTQQYLKVLNYNILSKRKILNP